MHKLQQSLYIILKQPFFRQFMVGWRWRLDWGNQSDWEQIEMKSPTGSILSGLIGESTIPNVKGSIVLAHPMGKAAKGFFLKHGHAQLLRDAGFHVLLFDFNGFGESSCGDFNYHRDLICAATCMKSKYPELAIGVLGVSFGASWAICAAAENKELIEAVVIDSAFTSLPEFWKRYPFAYYVLNVMKFLNPALEKRLRPIYRMNSVDPKTRVLFIYGDDDIYTPPEMGKRLLQANKDELAELILISNAQHTFALKTDQELYRSRVTEFFESSLSNVRIPG